MPSVAVRSVVIVVFPEVQSLDVVGPAEVFAVAAHLSGADEYAVQVVASGVGSVGMSNGLELVPHASLSAASGEPIDTLVVAGGEGTRNAVRDESLIDWVRDAAGRSRRVASVCTGAFVLARAGLLDGRRATTHWAACGELERRFPAVCVERDAIFVVDDVYTSAGVSAGMDLALALVEEDLGPRVARDVAQQLVLFLRRPGGQSQFSAPLSALPAERESLRELQAWIAAHPTADLSVAVLADRVHMSPRNFARAFARESGATPGAYVESVRVERARIALEATGATVEAVAHECGFGTVETMRRAFHRRLAVSPAAYRERFSPVLAA